MFFESVLDRLVEEVYHQELFEYQNVSLLNQVAKMEVLKGLTEEDRHAAINKTYNTIIKGSSGLLDELAAATGVTGSHNGR